MGVKLYSKYMYNTHHANMQIMCIQLNQCIYNILEHHFNIFGWLRFDSQFASKLSTNLHLGDYRSFLWFLILNAQLEGNRVTVMIAFDLRKKKKNTIGQRFHSWTDPMDLTIPVLVGFRFKSPRDCESWYSNFFKWHGLSEILIILPWFDKARAASPTLRFPWALCPALCIQIGKLSHVKFSNFA